MLQLCTVNGLRHKCFVLIWPILAIYKSACMMHATTHVSTAVRPSALGALAVTELKMFTRTRKSVTSRDMRPET